MINAANIIDYNRTDEQLQELLLFCVAVAGKSSKQIEKALDNFLSLRFNLNRSKPLSPFKFIRFMNLFTKLTGCKDVLRSRIIDSKLGQHNKLTRSFTELSESRLDLRKCSIEDLMKIYGIGPKTARFFISSSRPNQKMAILDTHILKYISRYKNNIPKSTPSGKKYIELEKWFIKHCEERGVQNISEFDLLLWKKSSGR